MGEKSIAILTKKKELISELVGLKKKKITDSDIYNVGRKYGLSKKSSKRAWTNFVETGGKLIDKRQNGNGILTVKCNGTKVRYNKKNTAVDSKTAGNIIKEYMHNSCDVTSRDLCLKYQVGINQFYEWLHELNVKGTLLGRKVLDPRKYAKIDVKDAIWVRKNPGTKRKTIRNLSDMELKALKRVAQVLEEYL